MAAAPATPRHPRGHTPPKRRRNQTTRQIGRHTLVKKQPGRNLTLKSLMTILGDAHNYTDFVRTLTERYNPSAKGLFFVVHGDKTVGPEAPQVYIRMGKAMIAYAPHTYAEVFWTEGDETINFQIAEEPLDHEQGTPLQGKSIMTEKVARRMGIEPPSGAEKAEKAAPAVARPRIPSRLSRSKKKRKGAWALLDEQATAGAAEEEEIGTFASMVDDDLKGARTRLTINAYAFVKDGGMKSVPDFALTPEQIIKMHSEELIEKTNRFGNKACRGCHMSARRRNAEADNHPRRFVADPNWKFRREVDGKRVRQKLAGIFDRFASTNRDNDLYRWLWEQPDVIARGGKLMPGDTHEYKKFIQDTIVRSGREMLRELKRHESWPRGSAAFAAAVHDTPNVDHVLRRVLAETTGPSISHGELLAARQDATRRHAVMNLQHLRARDRESMMFILGDGDIEKAQQFADNDLLLLNQHSIETIGPEILNMIVSDAEWEKLSSDEKSEKVRLRDLAVKDMAHLRQICLAPRVVERTRRRTNTYLALYGIFRNKNLAQSHLSTRVLKVGAETGNWDVDLLDVYKAGIERPE